MDYTGNAKGKGGRHTVPFVLASKDEMCGEINEQLVTLADWQTISKEIKKNAELQEVLMLGALIKLKMHCREQQSNEISEQKANKIAGFGVSSLLMRVGFAHEIGESNGLSYIKIPNFSSEHICTREQKAFETEKKRKQRASDRNGEFVPDFRDTCPQNEDSTREHCPPYHNISYQNKSYHTISEQSIPEHTIPDNFYPEEDEMSGVNASFSPSGGIRGDKNVHPCLAGALPNADYSAETLAREIFRVLGKQYSSGADIPECREYVRLYAGRLLPLDRVAEVVRASEVRGLAGAVEAIKRASESAGGGAV